MKSGPQSKEIYEIVFTGGPCGGKSTALAVLGERLPQLGIRVLTVSEVASLFITGGFPDLGELARDPQWLFNFESQMLLTQRALRSAFLELAQNAPERTVVILYDRAEHDIAAYMDPASYAALLEQHRLSLADVRDSYSLVIHLRTAALGAEEHYTLANNQARRETLEEARELDHRTAQVWLGQPNYALVDNSTDFEGKLQRVVQLVSRHIGLPVPTPVERRYLVLDPLPTGHPALKSAGPPVEIEITFLKRTQHGVERRLDQRLQNGQASFFLVERRTNTGAGLERARHISYREYLQLMRERDPRRVPIRKKRTCLIHEDQYLEIDEISSPRQLTLLEIEGSEKNPNQRLPRFLGRLADVTGDPALTTSGLAMGRGRGLADG